MSMASAGAGCDEAGNAGLVFDEGEHAVDGKGRQRVQRRHGQVNLDAAGGFFLGLQVSTRGNQQTYAGAA